MAPDADDLARLRREYADRERRLAGRNTYSLFHPGHLYMLQARERAVLGLLRRHGFADLRDRRILELGCGRGGVLLEYLRYGATPSRLHGTDLLPDRVGDAHALLPHVPLTCSDGRRLPYADGTFDLVLQYTVFSSVLDDDVKAALAREMLRVLRPDGLIVWYDFWLNPTNRQTRGSGPPRSAACSRAVATISTASPSRHPSLTGWPRAPGWPATPWRACGCSTRITWLGSGGPEGSGDALRTELGPTCRPSRHPQPAFGRAISRVRRNWLRL